MSKRYTLTVYIAAPGTPLINDKGQPLIDSKSGKQDHSMVGHLYYKISDGTEDGTKGYGFAPLNEGEPFGPGKIYENEYLKYKGPVYERQLEISEAQYKKLSDYGGDPKLGGFDITTYNGLNNSCIDFTFVALKYAGIYQGRKASVYDDLGNEISYTDRRHEGTVKVVPNIREFEKIPAPFPSSPLNKTIHRDMPERTWIQKRLTEHEQEQPYQYAQARPLTLADMPEQVQDMCAQCRALLVEFDREEGVTRSSSDYDAISRSMAVQAYAAGLPEVQFIHVEENGQINIAYEAPSGMFKDTSIHTDKALRTSLEDSITQSKQAERDLALAAEQLAREIAEYRAQSYGGRSIG